MIELTKVSKVFPGPVTALDEVDLSIPAGQIHGIVGRSGAGKSTLIRCLTGLDRATSGSIEVGGVDMGSAKGSALAGARRQIGMVSQNVNLLDSRTAEKNIAHPLEIAGAKPADIAARVDELLELVGLTERRKNYPAQLSGGQQQRVGIARALATNAPVLLCDEPTSALDTATTRQILELIRRVRDRLGVTVLIITHEMSVVREVCDSVTLLAEGRVERTGPILDVIGDAGSPLAKELIPMPSSGTSRDGETLLEIMTSEGASRPDVTEIFALLRQEGIEATIEAGTIETISGRQIGRLHLRPKRPQDDIAAALQLLRSKGIYAQPLGDAEGETA